MSNAGVVTAVAAGEATIAADVNGTRGSLPVRVLPNFGGAWSGTETVVSCTDSGQISGFCSLSEFVGEVFFHESSFTQNQASVTGVLDAGDGTRATITGVITVDCDLPLDSAPVLPAEFQSLPYRLSIVAWMSRTQCVPGDTAVPVAG